MYECLWHNAHKHSSPDFVSVMCVGMEWSDIASKTIFYDILNHWNHLLLPNIYTVKQYLLEIIYFQMVDLQADVVILVLSELSDYDNTYFGECV